jgi:hypothetical protein
MAIDSINRAASQIAGAIRDAAHSTGVSFEYLLTTAQIESNLNPAAQATTSTAKGLYQFIEQTWLATLKQAGPALGLGQYSAAIVQGADGRYAVADPQARAAVMKLRGDPSASALVAGAFTRSNEARLAAALGRAPSQGELYIAHFLGSDGAAKLIATAASQPHANAAAMFPAAAAANRSIFYGPTGNAHSAADVYNQLNGRYEIAHALAFNPKSGLRGSIDAGSPQPHPSAAPAAGPMPADTAALTQVYAQARAPQAGLPPSAPQNPQPGPQPSAFFHSMFTDGPRRGVSQTVNNLWAPKANAAGASQQPSALLDLFRDRAPAARKRAGGNA